MPSREFVRSIYRDTVYPSNAHYGHTNHGQAAMPLIKAIAPKAFLDVGCGDGAMCRHVKSFCPVVHGLDFASKPHGAGIIFHDTYAQNIPLGDKSVDLVTAFDVLEHIYEEDIDQTLSEMARVACKYMIFSICTRPAAIEVAGENLHPTVHNIQWWHRKLSRYGSVYQWGDGYTVVKLADTFHNMIHDKKVCLVGPAPTAENDLDGFDVVVRMNSALERCNDRCDILCHAWAPDSHTVLPFWG